MVQNLAWVPTKHSVCGRGRLREDAKTRRKTSTLSGIKMDDKYVSSTLSGIKMDDKYVLAVL